MINTISSGVLFGRIQKLFRPSDSSWRVDAKDYMGFRIKGIGYGVPAIKVKKTVKVENHIFKIPNDMKSVIAIEYNGRKLEKNSFIGAIIERGISESEDIQKDGNVIELRELAQEYNDVYTLYLEKKEDLLLNPTTELQETVDLMYDRLQRIQRDIANLVAPLNKPTTNIPPFYDLEPGYVVTSFKDGDIVIHHHELPLDKDGLPLLVDSSNYIEALFWGVCMDLILSGYRHEDFSWRDAEERWLVYKKRASRTRQWSVDDAEQFLRLWLTYRFPQRLGQQIFMNDQISY